VAMNFGIVEAVNKQKGKQSPPGAEEILIAGNIDLYEYRPKKLEQCPILCIIKTIMVRNVIRRCGLTHGEWRMWNHVIRVSFVNTKLENSIRSIIDFFVSFAIPQPVTIPEFDERVVYQRKQQRY
jgi:hypothetical protein